MKKLLVALLALFILYGNGIVAHAQTSEDDKKAVTEKIMAAWDDYAESVTFDKEKLTIEEFKEVYHEAMLINPDYYFVSRSVSYESVDGYVTKANIKYEFEDWLDYINHRSEYSDTLYACINSMTAGGNDIKKLQYINDYLCENCDYDDSRVAKHNKNSYGALVNKCAVCEGYSMAFMALCKIANIECYMVTSDSMEHAWNVVKLGDDYYMIDSTWNDTSGDKYKYFLKSISWFNSDQGNHKADDYVIHGLTIPDTYECDEAYDDLDDYGWEHYWDEEEAIKLNHDELIFYGGAIIKYWTHDSFSTKLRLLNLPNNHSKITWASENTDIAEVDDDGNVVPKSCGRTNIVATYEGETYKCQVEAREIRSYFWHEYSGAPESNRWVWNNMDCLAVGQSVKYKFIEFIYDENGEVESETDVTDKIKLIQTSEDYLKIENGTITALKGGADQENNESKLFYYFRNTNVDYSQYIFINVFTDEKTDSNKYTLIYNNKWNNTLRFRASMESYMITFDDQPMQPADWVFYKCKLDDITWKVSDESVIKIVKKTGGIPEHVYSEVEYEVLKTGWATVSVYYGDDLIREKSFYFEKEDDSSESDNTDDGYDYDDSDGKDKSEKKDNTDSKSSDKSSNPEQKSTYKDEWVDGKWYNSDGTQTYKATLSWKQDATGWWVEDSDGWYPKNQWQRIDGKWYYFCADGYMDYSEYRDGCWLSSDGAWWEDYYGGTWGVNSTGWWYYDSSGWYPKSQWLWIDGVRYYFGADGYCTNP